MKLHSFALAALCTSLVVEASSVHDHHARTVNSRHARLSRRGDGTKRCRTRTPPAAPASLDGGNKDQGNNSSSNNNGQQGNNNDQQTNNNNGQQGGNNNQQGSNNNSQQGNNNGGGVISGSIGGLLSVASTCGDIGATQDITSTNGPNGALGWLNCGIDNEGWRPQNVQIGDLKVVDLNEALKDGNSPFHACQDFVDKFYQYGGQFNVPPVVLASIAMQESSCNPQTTGGGGECGMFQLTSDKWDGAPGGNCYDVDFNVRKGAEFFRQTLDNNGGNVLKAFGYYNGWQDGMTVGSATAAATSGCCTCQNNLD
ncbi:hypothetical protein V5O48_005698 [Marasmius crinis-equi]|uniref:Transglycosylase SLT domain-containing protein n=1 Tax=Marasmius crinis-equi TaxID=585013 RepID=A0ABR3FLM0_9AGAR